MKSFSSIRLFRVAAMTSFSIALAAMIALAGARNPKTAKTQTQEQQPAQTSPQTPAADQPPSRQHSRADRPNAKCQATRSARARSNRN